MAADPLTSRTVDDLLLQDVGFDTDDDPFADKPSRNAERDDKTVLSPRKRKADDVFGKDLDEEIKITKQRKKIPKLDADRLLSEPGIPKIRTQIRSGALKSKLRLKGKGHEFTDAAKLLNYYQMWLDNLYPRAKFADALLMVEKAGHTKKMQMYRKSWIDEGKPGFVRREDVDAAVDRQDAEQGREEEGGDHTRQEPEQSFEDDPAALFFGGEDEDVVTNEGGPDDDELDALMAQDNSGPTRLRKQTTVDNDSEGDDDLDALLAQEQPRKPRIPSLVEDEDELDVQRGDHQSRVSRQQQQPRQSKNSSEGHTVEADDELDMLLNHNADLEVADSDKPAAGKETFPDSFSEDDMDDLDALLTSDKKLAEPELPEITIPRTTLKNNNKNTSNVLPGSEEVPELDNVISSSPIPNVRTDELDSLMDEHDASVSRKHVDNELVEEFMSSSPIPNGESQ